MYLSIYFLFCYEMDIYAYMLKYQVSEERYPDLNEEEDTRLNKIREENCWDIHQESDNKKKIHALIWEVYVKPLN